MPNNSVLVRYADDNVIMRVMETWMTQLHPDFDQLHTDSYKNLKIFFRKALAIHLRHYFNGNEKCFYLTEVLDPVKGEDMNSITKNIRVPSLCRTNVADSVEII